jgi:gamma-D-glutamyl-L-lysine dipeptidyl-peptidase
MRFGICVVPVSPLRAEPSHRSEMVTQQLFGELCTIIDSAKDHWIKIKCSYDGYEGWCQEMHVMDASEEDAQAHRSTFTGDVINTLRFNDEPMLLPFGCRLPANTDGRLRVEYEGKIWDAATSRQEEETIRALAFRFLNTGYLWGGKSIFGIDCSGYTQTVYKMLDFPLLRDASQQATQGEVVGFLQEARCGDLAFFDNEAGKITHVGILLNDHEIIHSSGKVRLDKIDPAGIINKETSERTHNLRVIKRYFSTI